MRTETSLFHPAQYLDTQTAGTPIVILTGMNSSYDEWHEIVQTLQTTNRVLSFHRHSWREGDGIHRTSHAVQQLQKLLTHCGVGEPILLVGHSYGGLIAQEFAIRYPDQLKGLLLVDSTSVDLHELDALDTPVLDTLSSDATWIEQCRYYATQTNDQLRLLIQPTLTPAQHRLPLTIQSALLNFQIEPALYAMMASEVQHWKTDAQRIKRSPFPDLPLVVLGRDQRQAIAEGLQDGLPEAEVRQLEETWHQLLLRQANLTKTATIRFAERASHTIHLDRPELVISAIRQLDQAPTKDVLT
ncbi:alpha/beta fold hydrolase [Exiguobacterium antarcticum]|uniref:alpha/beta fold hydrolase n=1 Tax=Exiguobacterium antarcticum TaxID=132920 RepID=UPI00068A08D9|nr:alpha/beta hydrolase [Exiguobacterium antarcticum]